MRDAAKVERIKMNLLIYDTKDSVGISDKGDICRACGRAEVMETRSRLGDNALIALPVSAFMLPKRQDYLCECCRRERINWKRHNRALVRQNRPTTTV